jgi:2-hydroxymuconate-semialdehyde hydrolase
MTVTSFNTRDVILGDLSTRLIDEGSGSPLLLLHGSGAGVSAQVNWSNNIAAFAEKHRVLAPDLWGFGDSSRTPQDEYGLAVWTEQVIGLMDSMGLAETAIVGNSLGAWLAMDLAINHPERVSALVLMGSAGTKPLTPMINAHVSYTPSRERMEKLLNDFAYNPEFVTDWLVDQRYDRSITPGAQEAFVGTCKARDADARNRLVDLSSLAAAGHPTLLIHGKQDRVIPAAYSWEIAEAVPSSSLHVFGECGHWPQIEHAEKFNRLVLDYMNAWGC